MVSPARHRGGCSLKIGYFVSRFLGAVQSHTYTGQDGMEKTGVEIAVEKLEMLDSMPKEVKETLDVKETSESSNVQQL